TTAEKGYRKALAVRPDNPEALEGLGGTLVKAQQPGPAIALYQHATELEPASVDGWRGLFVAQFRNDQVTAALATFQLMPAAVRAQLKGDPGFLGPLASAYAAVGKTGEAQATLQDALKLPFAADQNGLKVEIQTQLAGLLSSANHLDEAVAMYKQVVSEDPGNAGAWESLARLQYAMGQDEEALETIERMPGPAYATAMHAPDFEVTVASIYERMKKLDKAQSVLQQAVTDETNAGQRPSAAIEMQLADIYAERGSPQLAYPVYQQVLRENPERADAWAGLLSALHVTGHDKEAVAQVALIPAGARGQLETNQSYLQTMAAVYARVGQTQQASQVQGRVAQENAVRHDAPAADAEIRRAWLLYNGLDDAGLYAQLMSLGGRTDLTADERRTVETIWTNWAGRRASQASAAGNTRRAVAILNAAARSFPDNPESIKLLAAAYLEAGQPHQAVLIYKEQNMASATASEYEGALSAALADGDSKDAGIWLGYAVAKFPADPQILILAARYEQARGDTARAVQYYRSSLQAMPPVNSGSKLAPELGLPATSAPMILPSAARPQDLSVLLAPGYIESPRMGDQPYLPDGSHSTGLPPYDGTTQLVPPFMTKPDGTKNGTGAEVNAAAEAAAAGQDASVHARNETAATAVAAQSQSPPDAEVYSAYVPYVAPPMRPTREIGSQPGPQSAVTVQLGNDTPQSVQAQTEVTDVLPTAHYGPSAKANQAAASREQAAAARAERIRRLREEGAAERSGQSHPAPDGTAGGMQDAQYTQPQIARPASPPAGYGAVPDTGAQQYPQPRTPPGSDRPGSDRVVIARSRPAPQPSAASSSPAPVQNSPVTQSAPALLAGAAVPSAPSNVSPVTAPGVPSSATQGVPTASPQPAAHSVPANAEVRANPVPPPEGMYSSQAPMPPIQRQQAEDELAALEGSYSGWLGGTGIARYRNGTAGLDRLYDLESPAEASLVVSRKVRITAIAEPVFLNSGTLNPADFSGVNVPYLGTLALDAANLPPRQFFNGVGGELQLAAKSFAVAAGYAPYEFPVRNVTGRFLWNAIGNHVALFGDRQPVKDTLLSYVGLHDPGSASPLSQSPVWGGVIATTGGLRLQFGNRAASFFVSGEGGVLTGRHVLDNYRFKGATGADFRIKNWPNAGELRLGATVSGMHYQHDEVGLTYGQGGYFSPDTYFLGAIPVSFQGHYKANFHYTIAGSVGAQAIQQNAAPFFPLDPGLQNSLVAAQGGACIGALTQTYACGEYPQVANMQFSYSFKSEASYRLADHWYGGGFASANNSSNFQAVSAGFFLRYVFRPQHSQEGYPAGVFHVDGLRPLQIP
ncbi:MAG TPA: cellulose synthase subunit BcsC-related outer membrane protein, partial [Acidobacteriaceae bacterium]|nr:cellulose synthase subunit BcsC-related outer membrane protein [Acidobacteriaceae bacterium]